MRLERIMVRPNPLTFAIPQVRKVLDRVVGDGKGWADPCAGVHGNSPAEFTNDLNPAAKTTHHGEGTAFLRGFQDASLDGVLLDPPYSLRQVKDCYEGFGRKVLKTEGQRFYADLKDEAARVIRPGGRCLHVRLEQRRPGQESPLPHGRGPPVPQRRRPQRHHPDRRAQARSAFGQGGE